MVLCTYTRRPLHQKTQLNMSVARALSRLNTPMSKRDHLSHPSLASLTDRRFDIIAQGMPAWQSPRHRSGCSSFAESVTTILPSEARSLPKSLTALRLAKRATQLACAWRGDERKGFRGALSRPRPGLAGLLNIFQTLLATGPWSRRNLGSFQRTLNKPH